MMSEKVKILYVDDEEHNLVSFRANFRKGYDVYTAISASEALDMLKEIHIPIIITDQKMPNTTGVEFLEKTLKLYPDCIRLLITAYTDIEDVKEAINRGQVSKYIQKPWDWDKLSLAIDNCVTLYTSRAELKLKNEELKKTNEELNKFVYSVSHDLRSPLTSILGIINLTKLTPELKVAESYFEMIEGRVLHLDSFIRKIIDYYKNARLVNEYDLLDFKVMVNSTWDALKNQNDSINYELSVNQDVTFLGDYYRLKVVFDNLMSNAIKYQNPFEDFKYIKVKIDVNTEFAKIVISDNGIGIAQIHFKHIFDLFYRTGNSLSAEGTGIGLYIVKEAVEKMEGEINVSSDKINGTAFEVIIPNKFSK